MTTEAKEITEGNSKIAFFMNAIPIYDAMESNHKSKSEVGFRADSWPENKRLWRIIDLKYHEDWKWQIPVYSKLAKAMQNIAWEEVGGSTQYTIMRDRYEQTVFNNDPLSGFKIIVENLTYFNTQTK